MDDYEKETLKENKEKLVDKMDACTLLPYLFQEKVIDMSQMETIRRYPSKRSQAESLYDCITTSPLQEAFSKLLEGLEKHDIHKDLVEPMQKSVGEKRISRTASLPSSRIMQRNFKDSAEFSPTSPTWAEDCIQAQADRNVKKSLTASKSLPVSGDSPRPHCMLHVYLSQTMIEECKLGVEVAKSGGSQSSSFIIMEIIESSAADEEGTLLQGDELIQVNDENTRCMTLEKLNTSLKRYFEIDGVPNLKLTIKRPAFSNTKKLEIHLHRKDTTVPFGFRFTSGTCKPRFPRDVSNYVSKVEKLSVAYEAGVKFRDTILQIDGRNVQHLEYGSLRQILKSENNDIKMLVSRENYELS